MPLKYFQIRRTEWKRREKRFLGCFKMLASMVGVMLLISARFKTFQWDFRTKNLRISISKLNSCWRKSFLTILNLDKNNYKIVTLDSIIIRWSYLKNIRNYLKIFTLILKSLRLGSPYSSKNYQRISQVFLTNYTFTSRFLSKSAFFAIQSKN